MLEYVNTVSIFKSKQNILNRIPPLMSYSNIYSLTNLRTNVADIDQRNHKDIISTEFHKAQISYHVGINGSVIHGHKKYAAPKNFV